MRKITFFSTIIGVAETYPIQESHKFKFNWVDQAKNDFKRKIEQVKGKQFHIYRCPGIFDLMSTGYIVPLPYDVLIETDGGGAGFKWTLPTTYFEKLLNSKIIDAHLSDGVAEHLPIKKGSLESIVKINSPWHIIAPEGVKFLIMPIPYPDSYEFECVHGILDPSVSTELNFQMRWNVLDDQILLKAGTPMFQIIPLTTEKFQLEVRDKLPADEQWLQKRFFINNSTFVLRRPIIKEAYRKFVSKFFK